MKKGFTLIELLAVIVILSIIALISTPIIMNAISNAKQGAWKDAAYGIVKATENTFAKGFSETTEPIDTFFLYENGVMTSYPSGKTIDYKGSVPQDGGIVLHADGSITLAIYDGSYCAVKTRTSGTVTVTTTNKATCLSNIYYKQSNAPFTNLIANGDFINGINGWTVNASSVSVSNKVATFIAGAAWTGIYQVPSFTKGHVVYSQATVKASSSNVIVGTNQTSKNHSGNGTFETLSVWCVQTNTLINSVVDIGSSNFKAVEVKNYISIDLTNTYGAGNEPTKAQMDDNVNKVWIDSTTNTPKRFTAGGWINF